MAVEQLYLNLAHRHTEDLVDPPGWPGSHGEGNDPIERAATIRYRRRNGRRT